MKRWWSLAWVGLVTLAVVPGAAQEPTQRDSFKRTDSRGPYVHQIALYDAVGRAIDAASAIRCPYSPHATCGKCHDIARIVAGTHFNAAATGPSAEPDGRPGEPWLLIERRSGTWLPTGYRSWRGTVAPADVGLDPAAFLRRFGRHLPGGSSGYAGAPSPTGPAGPWRLRGELEVDCMACHDGGRTWSLERWAKAIEVENFAWAPTVALGLGVVDGKVRGLPEDLDPATDEGRAQLPRTRYDGAAFAADGTVHFDVVRHPDDGSCLQCHSVVGERRHRWLDDGNVHARAGLGCVDCHRNGLDHHVVRGFEGEIHPSGESVASLSCRGCHLGIEGDAGGRFGAPVPEHRGLPPLHLETMSCTSCHSGPLPDETPRAVQTSLAHGLGLPSQSRAAEDPPRIVEPVFMRDASGVITPYRVVWPSYWGILEGEAVRPLHPDDVGRRLRRALRVRSDLAEIFQDDGGADRLAPGFEALSGAGAEAVLVSGGKLYRAGAEGRVGAASHPAATFEAWPLGHDVRPARRSLGSDGCHECHRDGAPFFHGVVTPSGPVPDGAPERLAMADLMGVDVGLMRAWERSFGGRDAFKWGGFLIAGLIVLVVLLQVLVGLDGVLAWFRRQRSPGDDRSAGEGS